MRRLGAIAALLAVGQAPAAPVRLADAPAQGALVRGEAGPGVVALALRTPDGASTPVTLAGGRFILGFDRDVPAAATLVATRADGSTLSVPLHVAPGGWRIERVNAPYHPPGFDARRPAELARIAAARDTDSGARGWLEPLAWPISGPIRGVFGAQRVYRGTPGSYHGGVDIAAATGVTVRAPASGRVVLVADPPFTLEGRLLIIDHGGGLQSSLMHLSRIDAAEGDAVAQGQPVGAVGMTGRATGPHLHWGLTWRGARLDPRVAAH